MKKFCLILVSFLIIFYVNAQNYQINFTGSGASTTVDSVFVQNITQNTSLTVMGGDILHLLAVVGFEQIAAHNKYIKVYPNPFSERTFIDFVHIKDGMVNIEIIDITGRNVCNFSKQLSTGIQVFELTGLKSGVYKLIINTTDSKYVSRIVSVSDSKAASNISFSGTLKAGYSDDVLKNSKATVPMQYNDGETLLFTAYAGNNSTVFTLIPTQNQTLNFVFSTCSDIDGNNYATVVIGTQTWMAENLKTTTLKNGTAIPEHTYNPTWGGLTTPAYAWYMNDTLNKYIYGALYNWHTVNTGNLCPAGWHVPSNAEWTTLSDFAGGQMVAGGKLKQTGFTYWLSPNSGATNEYGFTALPGGCRNVNGASIGIGITSYWFSATEFDTDEAYFCGCMHDFEMFGMASDYKSCGYYVRCLKD